MIRFNRPRLITADDPAYQAHVAQMLLQRANQRAIRPPSQRDLFGGEAEAILRQQLADQFALSDRRFLEYEERIGRTWQRKYRELDAIVIDGQRRAHVFEIKASRRAGAIHRALQQLRDTQSILRLALPLVSASVLLVDTGMITARERGQWIAEQEAAGVAVDRWPQTLDEAIAAHAEAQRIGSIAELRAFPDAVEIVVLSVDQIVQLAGDAPLSLDWDADEAEVDPPPAPRPATPRYSTPDEDDENPFAAALRRAHDRGK